MQDRVDAAARTTDFNLLWANETSGSRRDDLARLTSKAQLFPKTVYQAIKTVEGYATLLATVLGSINNDVIAVRGWSREIITKLGWLDHNQPDPERKVEYLARFLVQVHYAMHAFLEKLLLNSDPLSPNLQFITEYFERDQFDSLVQIPECNIRAARGPRNDSNHGGGSQGRALDVGHCGYVSSHQATTFHHQSGPTSLFRFTFFRPCAYCGVLSARPGNPRGDET
jgi:hypothetical protein